MSTQRGCLPHSGRGARGGGDRQRTCGELLNLLKSHGREDAKVPGAEAT